MHDHGFNNVSTYGNLLRLMREGQIAINEPRAGFLRAGPEGLRRGAGGALDPLATARGTSIPSTARTRCLWTPSARAGHSRWPINWGTCSWESKTRGFRCLERLVQHARPPRVHTASITGRRRDAYDVRGRDGSRGIFNVTSGTFRCPNSSRATRPSAPGRAVWRGRSAVSPRNWSSCRPGRPGVAAL